MILSALYVVWAVLSVAVLVELLRRRRARQRWYSDPVARFRIGPLWCWCEAERTFTPHLADAGSRRCLSCKTPSTNKETPHE